MSFGALRSNLDAATSGLAEIFASSFQKEFGYFELDEVEVTLEVSADGKVGIIGSGVGVRGMGSMKLKFVRRNSTFATVLVCSSLCGDDRSGR